MSEEMKPKTGTCAFCGQSVFVDTIGEVTQAELDSMATDKCMCPDAQSERRKKERKAKIEAYINKHFNERIGKFVREAIAMVVKPAHMTAGIMNGYIVIQACIHAACTKTIRNRPQNKHPIGRCSRES